ncbi:hypothetical protein FRB96_007333 [Tulasnella sp. 330]|nr:hypothetical protein FRB96_007333 [Tulasnella sp. 330]KAG8883695.1 hypothetical protein FRB98_002853 [Tulasnella sp. 332]
MSRSRTSSPSSIQPTFSGAPNEDVASFIQNIQQIAFARGRQRDYDWLADYAATCLTGTAMRWYSELEESQERDSWVLLRRALSQRFPPPLTPQLPPTPTTLAAQILSLEVLYHLFHLLPLQKIFRRLMMQIIKH